MTTPVVLVTAPTISDSAQSMLSEAGYAVEFMQFPIAEQDFLDAFATRKVVALMVRGSPPLSARVIEAGRDLRIVSKHGAGIDSIDVAAATARGIAVTVATGANADGVAELALALMLAVTRELASFHRRLEQGQWRDLSHVVRDFKLRTVGIVGYGEIGRRTAQLASACGARVIIHSRSAVQPPPGMEYEPSFDAFLKRVDIVSLHCALTEKTRGLIGARELALMPPGSIVVNTARGAVIDEDALVAALQSGHLGGAGLDTFAVEPLPADHPLLSAPNVICTPHVGASTIDAAEQLAAISCNNILSWMRGEVYDVRHFVNSEVLERRKPEGAIARSVGRV